MPGEMHQRMLCPRDLDQPSAQASQQQARHPRRGRALLPQAHPRVEGGQRVLPQHPLLSGRKAEILCSLF